MAVKPSTIAAELNRRTTVFGRPHPKGSPLQRLASVYEQAIALGDGLHGRRDELRSKGELTAKGLSQLMTAEARERILPSFFRLQHEAERVREIAVDKRSKIVLRRDETASRRAIENMEIRTWLRGLEYPEAIKHAMDNPRIAEAIVE